jgi:Leucine-rich repeat (LRR) protein
LVAGYDPFSGSVPDLSALGSLQDVDLQQAGFSGTLPLLPASLQSLALSSNAMTGDLWGIEGLPNLQTFNGSNNQFSGSLPDLSTLPSLNYFSVANNQLTGTIPSLAGHNFFALVLSPNQFTGRVPDLSGQNNLTDTVFGNGFGAPPTLQ